MAIHRLRIVGVHYAVNPESTSREAETEQMHQRTAERLRQLDEQRPRVVLMAEPSNPVDNYAVMARVAGKRIGYVEKSQLDLVQALIKAKGGQPLLAQIDEVEAKKHGWLYVTFDVADGLPVEPQNRPQTDWSGWESAYPVLAPDDAQFACMEAEAVLAEVLHTLPSENIPNIDLIEEYISLWLKNSLHDLSAEARLTREHYISVLKQGPDDPRIQALTDALEKQCTAICGGKRMKLRIEVWWKQLLESPQMQLLWDSWVASHGGDLEATLNESFTLLQTLPADLNGVLNHKDLFFSRLYYNQVPRTIFWQIVSVMLLRERTLMEQDVTKRDTPTETTPLNQGSGLSTPSDEADTKFEVTIPEELNTPLAKKILAKLQKKGYLDEDLQPLGISKTKAAFLIWEVGDRLNIKNIWVLAGILWKCGGETLRQYRSNGYHNDSNQDFAKKIKQLIY